MKTGKMPNMVAEAPNRKMGRPRKFFGAAKRLQILMPDDLCSAAASVQQELRLPEFADAVRELVREAAERRRLVQPRR